MGLRKAVASVGVAGLAVAAVTSAFASTALASGPLLYIKGLAQTNGASHEVETRIRPGTTFVLESAVGGTPFTLTSTEVKSTEAEIVGSQPPVDSVKAITFTGVKVTAPSSCVTDEVSSRTSPSGTKTAVATVATKPVSTLFEPGGASGIADTFTPVLEESKEVFVEIQLKTPRGSECPIPTEYYKVTGHESGEVLEPDTEAEWKTLKFPVASLSSLSFGGEPAALAGEAELRLTTHEEFTVREPELPNWKVNGAFLGTGVKEPLTAVKGAGEYFLEYNTAPKVRLDCAEETFGGELVGGSPGTDKDTMTLEKCVVTEPANCSVRNGEVAIASNTELVYLIEKGGEWQEATEAEWLAAEVRHFGDRFNLVNGGFTVELQGAGCGQAGKTYTVTGYFITIVMGEKLEFRPSEKAMNHLAFEGGEWKAINSVTMKATGGTIEVARS